MRPVGCDPIRPGLWSRRAAPLPWRGRCAVDEGALADLRVVDWAAGLAGPFPGGVPHPEKSGQFLYLNANKRGVTLDLDGAGG